MTPFSLLGLPPKAIQEVLRNVDPQYIILLSLCSRRTKRLAKSINLPLDKIDIHIEIACYVNITLAAGIPPVSFQFSNQPRGLAATLRPSAFRITCGENTQHFKSDSFELGHWFRHILSVFNATCIETLLIRFCRFTVDSLKECLKGIRWKRIVLTQQPIEKSQKILETLHSTSEVQINGSPFGGTNEFLSQNVEVLVVSTARDLKFNDFLMMNASYIHLDRVSLTEKELNRFIKLSIKGANPRMKCAHFESVPGEWNVDDVLDGIKYQRMAPGVTKTIRTLVGHIPTDVECQGGYEFDGFDGKKVTVVLEHANYRPVFEMIIE